MIRVLLPLLIVLSLTACSASMARPVSARPAPSEIIFEERSAGVSASASASPVAMVETRQDDGVASETPALKENPRLRKAIDAAGRPEEQKARDKYRNPYETLSFFEVEPGHTVVEIAPGGGWYTEILARYLKGKGMLFAAHFDPNAEREYYRKSRAGFEKRFANNSEEFGTMQLTIFQPPEKMDIAPPGVADRVLTFRNVHNWMKNDGAQEAFNTFARVLKPGGILGVVEHRLPKGQRQDPNAESGYVSEKTVIQLAKNAGLELVGRAEINANPKDDANHPKGVWTLPPSLRLGEKDKAKYEYIGESDRMTLKFRKVR